MTTPATDFAHSAHAERQRLDKARALAGWLWTHGVDAAEAAGLDDAARAHVARDADANRPSWDTWAVVVTKLEQAAERPDMAGSFGSEGRPEWLTTETGSPKNISSASPNTTTSVAAADTAVSGSPDTEDVPGLADSIARHPAGKRRTAPVQVVMPRGWQERIDSGATLAVKCSVKDCIAPAVAALMCEFRCAGHPPQPGEWGHKLNWAPRTQGSCAKSRCYCGACPQFRLAPVPTVPTPREDKRKARA